MTNKDLNLNLDPRLTGKSEGGPQGVKRRTTKKRRVPTSLEAVRQLSTVEIGDEPGAESALSPWSVMAAVLLLVNTLALSAAGYWLYAHPALVTVTENPIAAAPGPDIAGTMTRLEQQLGALDSRLAQLQLALTEQQQYFSAGFLDMQEQLGAMQAARAVASKAAAEAPAPVADKWVINAGTYSSEAEAGRLVDHLTDMGLVAVVSENGTSHRVQVTGFEDRTSAEEAARDIVEKTNINGLWVWKDD